MDVFFEPQTGSPFSIELGYFDTVLEIKEKVLKYREALLQSSGVELKDNHSLRECELMDNSEINVNIRPSSTGFRNRLYRRRYHWNKEAEIDGVAESMMVKVVYSEGDMSCMFSESNPNPTILDLKQMIHQLIDVSPEWHALYFSGESLLNQARQQYYKIDENSVINLIRFMEVMLVYKGERRKVLIHEDARGFELKKAMLSVYLV
ncbi:hypothetical protein GH714_000958 [Hevea brasiliensis]|uniref:Ubiquitin-like domain-containing protein n=1 Tax=Hevea brasiliensis TaxID=3981 RepID=A0A6A6LXN8_HEVBR|nr:hypothetical protein GH714_000958 [Hevea brasiliensis]